MRVQKSGLLETVISLVGVAQSLKDIGDILSSVLLGILEVIIHNFGGIQAELSSSLGLGGVINYQELIGAGAGSLVDALGREGVLDEQLGSIGVLGALEDGGSADLEGGTGGRNDQGDVLIAIIEGPEPLLV